MASTQSLYAADGRRAGYAPAMRWLHWITALLIVAMFALAIWFKAFDPGDGPLKAMLYNLHESIGVTIWVLVLVRIVVRLATGAPKLPVGTPGAVRLLATLNHIALYLVLLVQPVIGVLVANAWVGPLQWFGLFPIPALIGKQPESVGHNLDYLHSLGALALLLLLILHVAGALYHATVRRDGVIRHMA